MLIGHKIGVLITNFFSYVSLLLPNFSIRPILNPRPFFRYFLAFPYHSYDKKEGFVSVQPKIFFALMHWLRHFPRKLWEDNQNPNTLKNFYPYKISFFLKFVKGIHKYRGEEGSRIFGKNQNRSRYFLRIASLSENLFLH